MTEHDRALSSSFLSVHRHSHTHRGSSNESFTPSTCPCSCERFSSPSSPLLTHFLPHSFPFLLHLKFVDYNLLLTPHKEGMNLSDEFLFTTNYEPTTSRRPQSSPTRSSWTRRRSSATKSLLRTPTTMTLHSRICSIKYTEHMPITLYEKTCLSVCRRQCPIERGDPLEIERGDPLSKETRKHRSGLCSTNKRVNFCRVPSKK